MSPRHSRSAVLETYCPVVNLLYYIVYIRPTRRVLTLPTHPPRTARHDNVTPASRSAANKINMYISPSDQSPAVCRRKGFLPPALKGPKPFNQEIVDYSASPRAQ